MDHFAKIGFLVGPNLKFSNLKNHEKMIAEIIGSEENEFDAVRSNAKNQRKKSQCVVISLVLSSK